MKQLPVLYIFSVASNGDDTTAGSYLVMIFIGLQITLIECVVSISWRE